mmetsp:Transcript_8527/g.14401  ORF Transcript_8527/g.14401 Transcript_8527/m.14401 type:complete len:268 (-) Transcript_8527:817-1620(-)
MTSTAVTMAKAMKTKRVLPKRVGCLLKRLVVVVVVVAWQPWRVVSAPRGRPLLPPSLLRHRHRLRCLPGFFRGLQKLNHRVWDGPATASSSAAASAAGPATAAAAAASTHRHKPAVVIAVLPLLPRRLKRFRKWVVVVDARTAVLEGHRAGGTTRRQRGCLPWLLLVLLVRGRGVASDGLFRTSRDGSRLVQKRRGRCRRFSTQVVAPAGRLLPLFLLLPLQGRHLPQRRFRGVGASAGEGGDGAHGAMRPRRRGRRRRVTVVSCSS